METNIQECQHCETENLTVCVEPRDIVQDYEDPKFEESYEDRVEFGAIKDETQEALNSLGRECFNRCEAEYNQDNGRHAARRKIITQLHNGVSAEEKREAVLRRIREHQRLRFIRETEEQRQQRLQRVREYQRKRIQGETKQQREARIQKVREHQRRKRLTETEEERAKRLQKVRENQRRRISEETPEQREIRLRKVREAQRLRRLSETEEQRVARIRRVVEYQRRRAKQEKYDGGYQKCEKNILPGLIQGVSKCVTEPLAFKLEPKEYPETYTGAH